jgi:hypothetical protein
MAKSREHWSIGDYVEELIHLWEIDHIPETMRKIMVLKTEMLSRFSTEELEACGVTLAH